MKHKKIKGCVLKAKNKNDQERGGDLHLHVPADNFFIS